MLKVSLQSFPVLFLCVIAVLTGCATTPPQSSSSVVERSPIDLREERISLLSDRVQRQDQVLDKLTQTVSELKRQVQRLTKATETASATQGLPVEKLSPEGVVMGAVAAEGEEGSGQSSEGEIVADSKDATMHLYYEGLKYSRAKQYDESVRVLREFLKGAPEHIYADRAQFLIADDHFRNQEYELAIVDTNQLESQYPSSFKVPDALLTRALSYDGLGQTTEAKATLQDLMRRYPSDPAADAAAKKLAELVTSGNGNDTQKETPPKLINELD